MKNLQTQICEFLEDNTGPFLNIKGVEFDLDEDTINAGSNLPGFIEQENYNLELFYPRHSIKSFIKRFSLNSLSDLHQISPEQLEMMFNAGHAEMWCFIYPSERYLIFTKRGANFKVVDDYDMEHMLDKTLNKHEDFHNYTRFYFSE